MPSIQPGLLLAAALVVYCGVQKPRKPFFFALVIGVVAGAVLGTILLGAKYGVFADTFPIVIIYPPIGGLAGAYLAVAIAGLSIDPPERRAAAKLGAVAGLALGWPLLLLLPQSWFENELVLPCALAAAGIMVSLAAGFAGALLAGVSAERKQAGMRMSGLATAFLLVIAIALSMQVYRHISPAGRLAQSGDIAGLRYKVEKGDPQTKYPAAAAYARTAPDKAITDKDKFVRYEAAIVLGEQQDERALPVLAEAVADREWNFPALDQRVQAVEVLGKMRGPGAAELLQKARRSPVVQVREAAVKALAGVPLKTTKVRHGSSTVEAVCFSPDGKTLASGGSKSEGATSIGEVRLWDVESGNLLRTIRPHPEGSKGFDQVVALAFTPDGKTLTCANGGEVTLWNMTTGEKGRVLAVPPRQVMAMTLAPNRGTLIAAHGDRVLRWDVASGRQLGELPRLGGFPQMLVCSKDGRQIAGGDDQGQAGIWDLATGKLSKVWRAHTSGAVRVALLPGTDRMATTGDCGREYRAKLWTLPDQKEVYSLHAVSNAVSVAASPDGKTLATGHEDYTVRLWDAASGDLKQTLTTETHPLQTGSMAGIRAVGFSGDGSRVAAGDSAGNVLIWRLK